MQTFDSVPGGGNPDAEQEQATGRCVKVYQGPDGFIVSLTEDEPMPEGGEPAADIEEAMQLAREKLESDSTQEAGDDTMRGYNRMRKPGMGQSTGMDPASVFGEG